MFDLQDERTTRVIKGDPESRLEFEDHAPEGDDDRHVLDGDESVKLHNRLMGHYQRELDRQYDNRVEMAQDEDFYDNIQWTEEDKQTLKDRGQAPLTYNVISQTINWIIGSEKRGRTDFKVQPRGKEDSKPAEKKTQLLKYLSDVNRTPFHRSRAFEDSVKVGVGWLEDGVTDDDDGEPIYSRYESWRNMLWDSASTELDLSDARYVIRAKWVDLDIATTIFPDRQHLLERSAQVGDSFGYDLANGDEIMDFGENEREELSRGFSDLADARRDRVRLIEVWFRKPMRAQKLIGGQFNGERYDEASPGHAESVQAGHAVLAERAMLQMMCAVMTTEGLLYVGESPYRHNRFPFTPIWGYRRGRDGLPYGVVRGLKDIQEDINKRASKALFILSSNKVIADNDATDDWDELLDEIARPDGVLRVKTGKRFELAVDRELAPAHLDLMARSINMIQSVSGVTDEQMGRTTNAKSGVAIQARQEQGAMSTSKLFDNLRLANQIQGEKQLSLAEQYFTEKKQFRITNQRGTPDYIDINTGLPEDDITRSKADFVISDAEWRASLRQAQAEQLMEMVTRMPPQVAMVMLDLVVESMDLPNRDELVKRIRQVTGMRDPDATELTTEEQAAQQAAAQQQQFQQQMAMANLEKLMSEIAKNMATAQKTSAEVAKTNVETQASAVTTAHTAMQAPGLLPVADGIMQEAGFVSATDQQRAQQEQAIAEQQQAQQAQEQAALEQQQMQQAPEGAMQQQPAPDGAAPQP